MSRQEENIESRRRFLKIAVGTVTTAIAMGGLAGLVRATDLPHLTDSDPTAKALGYVDDAGATKSSLFKAGSTCANCQFYAGDANGYGACQLFPGKGVNAKGWCTSYTAKKS